MPTDEDVLTSAEICKILRISKATFYRLMARGKMPACVMVGNTHRFLRSEVNKFLKGDCPK